MPSGLFGDDKYLVILVSNGGRDGYATVIPTDATRQGVLAAARPNLHIPTSAMTATALGGGSDLALHPSLEPLMAAWNAGDMAIGHDVGTMFDPLAGLTTTAIRNAYNSGDNSILFPIGLRAHDTQQYQIASMITREYNDGSTDRTTRESGFAGRLMELFSPYVGTSPLPGTIQKGDFGPTADLVGRTPTFTPLAVPPLYSYFALNTYGEPASALALTRMTNILAQTYTSKRANLYKRAFLTAQAATAFYNPVLTTSHTVDASFAADGAGWRRGMKAIARAIEDRGARGGLPKRTVFILSQGDYDTHAYQAGRLAGLHSDWANAIADFRTAMIALGLWNDCVVMDMTEFGRNVAENGGLGTDHGWGNHIMAFGGEIRGAGKDSSTGFFGTYPAVISANGSGTRDISSGALIPGISWEQWFENVLVWFGATTSDLNAALPRRAVFPSPIDLIV